MSVGWIGRRRRRQITSAAAVVLSGVALTACGGDDKPSAEDEKAEVTRVLRNFNTRAVAEAGPSACELLTDAGRKRVIDFVSPNVQGGVKTCEEAAGPNYRAVYEQILEVPASDVANAKILKVVVRGERATATAAQGKLGEQDAELQKVAGTWKIDVPPGLADEE